MTIRGTNAAETCTVAFTYSSDPDSAYTGILRVNGSYVMDTSSHYVANVQNTPAIVHLYGYGGNDVIDLEPALLVQPIEGVREWRGWFRHDLR